MTVTALPELTVRERTPQQGTRRPTYRAEVALALGPQVMGQPGDGSYATLHAAPWMLRWGKGDGLRLYQQQGGAWVEVQPGQAFPVLPDTARHISLAFDQSARHVAAWEDAAQVFVRQWTSDEQAYMYRGPFTGVDPLLLADSSVMYDVTVSDVILFYADPARQKIMYRIQRELYAVEHTYVEGLTGAVLDQVVIAPYAAYVLGESAGEPLTVEIGGYPYFARDVATAAISAPTGGETVAVTVSVTSEDAALHALTVPAGGDLKDATYTGTEENAATYVFSVPSGGLLKDATYTADAQTAAAHTVNTPSGGALVTVTLNVIPTDTVAIAAITTPSGGALT